jgi:predicted HTH domain antitoxin
MNEVKILQELAITLFQKEKLTLGQAATLAGISQFQFQQLLGSRGITIHYDVQDYTEDLQTIQRLGL